MSQREIARRTLHLALGFLSLSVPFIGWKLTAWLAACFAVLNAAVLPRLPLTRWLLRPGESREQEGRRGLVTYPLCVLALALLFQEDSLGIQVGWLSLALCDGLAPMIAVGVKGPHWPWALEKRILPSLIAAGIASVVMICLLPLPAQWAVGAATLAMLGESLETSIDDNLTTAGGGALGLVLARHLL